MLTKYYFEIFAFANRCKFRVQSTDKSVKSWDAYDISYDNFIEKYGDLVLKRVKFEYNMFDGYGVFSVDIDIPAIAKLFD